MKILIFGLPGSGKSTLAEPFANLINGHWVNADQVRQQYDDWDFTTEGRIRQAQRMRYICDGIVRAGGTAIADFVCPTAQARIEFDADYTVWLDTIAEGIFEDTNQMFEKPTTYDYHVNKWFHDTPEQLMKVVTNFQLTKDGKPTNNV
ncbi:adenylyl-sulfate kinase [bacterium]|nr:adenylyl-sulfate kinase [bacterium]